MENIRKRKQTRQSLKNALIDLCEKKTYYDITIWDICNQAGTYRSTFYRYYDSKDELLREIEREYIAETQSLIDTIRDFSSDATQEQLQKYREELTADMKYHMEHEKICIFLLSPAGDLAFRQQMQESIGSTIRKAQKKDRVLHINDYSINFFASGFISTISFWLERKDRAPEQIAGFLLDMMLRLEREDSIP